MVMIWLSGILLVLALVVGVLAATVRRLDGCERAG